MNANSDLTCWAWLWRKSKMEVMPIRHVLSGKIRAEHFRKPCRFFGEVTPIEDSGRPDEYGLYGRDGVKRIG